MAMSLEDLLSEEGFRRRKAKMTSRSSFASEGRGIPCHTQSGKLESSSLMAVKRTQRTRSDIPRHDSKGEFSTSSSFRGGKPRDNLSRRDPIDLESEKARILKHERRSHQDSWDVQRFDDGLPGDSLGPEITEVVESDEIVEARIGSQYKDLYLNKVYGYEGNHSTRNEDKNNIIIDKKIRNNSFNHSLPPPEQRSFNVNSRNSMKQPQSYDNKSNRISDDNKFFDERASERMIKIEEAIATPALDEAAVKAIISILSGYVRRFLRDEDFRASLRHNSFASLNFIGLEEGLNTESKVIENLEQAIEIAEKAVEEMATLKELKRASLQLSVITGLNTDDLKDRFTSGIQNFKLSACAHLYLSVIYMIQKRDGISAKHLLQVFCNSPFQARSALLPDLWEQLFLPHFSHLKLWYDKEAHSLADSPVASNLKLLEKEYNEILDSGTYQFALYYKNWLAEGVEAPSVPLIKIPSLSGQLIPKGGSHGHASSPGSRISPRPMVSKKLYDEVFGHSHNVDGKYKVNEDSPSSPASEEKQLILYSHDSVSCTNRDSEPDGESLPDDPHVAKEAEILNQEFSQKELCISEVYGDCQWYQEHSDMPNMFQAQPPAREIKLLCGIPEKPINCVAFRFELHPDAAAYQTGLESPTVKEQQRDHEVFCENTCLFSIPEEFLCPITGLLLEDPVTLETGQTFERQAITDWFDKESITCPLTRKALQCQTVPHTNLILKRLIDHWMREHYMHLSALFSRAPGKTHDNMIISTLERLLFVLSKDDRIVNARRIVSLGGLQFLLKIFHYGNDEEKTRVLPLLSCCIEADSGCRSYVARNINKSDLIELLHSERSKSITNAVLLLTELICLNRRNGAKSFLDGLQNEEIIHVMDDLLVYLQTCRLEEGPLVAVLLLHIDLLSECHISKIYRQEAVDALTITLERSLSDENTQKKCSKALLVLGGCFSSSGKLMTEDWVLKLSGFLTCLEWDITDNETNDIAVDAKVTKVDSLAEDGDEEKARDKWLCNLSAVLITDGKKSFLETVSKCLSLGNSDLVRVCLTTVAWLSSSLASLSETELQLYAFSLLISPLKNCLDYGDLVEHKILASLSILNFTKIPDCRILLVNIGDEMRTSLENLEEVTWTAKELLTIISRR